MHKEGQSPDQPSPEAFVVLFFHPKSKHDLQMDQAIAQDLCDLWPL